MKKRILPALLALCMVMSLLPTVFADGAAVTCSCTSNTCTNSSHTDKGTACGATVEDTSNENTLCNACKSTSTTTTPGTTTTPEEGDEDEVIYCNCSAEHTAWIDNSGESPVAKTTCPNTVSESGLCATCAKKADHNPCNIGGCTLLKGHDGNHNNTSCLSANETEKAKCGAATHNAGCPNKCDLDVDAWKTPEAVGQAEGDEEAPTAWEKDGKESCNLTKGHSGPHSNTKCIKDAKCGASTHAPDCPVASTSGQCGLGGCDKAKGHSGDHNNTVCLGVNDDGHCAAPEHIAGCSSYTCGCSHSYTPVEKEWSTAFNPEGFECTSAAGCTYCNKWNAFVSSLKAAYARQKAAYDADQEKETPTGVQDPGAAPTIAACTCKDCAPNPPTGALVNNEGEEVENPVAGDDEGDKTVEEKFADADKMTTEEKDAVQVMIDNKWMEGDGENFNGRGAADTNVVLTVIARMAGETITGTEWADLAKAWAEENDLTEGIEITKADMARKDIVLMLWRLAGKPEVEQELEFDDIDELEGDYVAALKWAVATGIVKGNGDGTVSPDGTLKRSELAIMVSRYAANVK